MHPLVANWPAGVALACYAAVAGAHLTLVRRNGARLRDVIFVQAGLLTALLAIISPVGYWSGVYLWVRAIGDLMLTFVAPALIVLGRPWLVLRQPKPAHTDTVLRAGGMPGPPGGGLVAREDLPEVETAWSRTAPVLAVAVFNLVWIGLQLPAAVDIVPGHPAARAAEEVCFLAAGLWFWLQLAGPARPGRWQTPLRRFALLSVTVASGTVLGMVLVFGSSVVYPAYGNPGHHVLTVLDDQQLSGAVLWMGMLPPLIIAGVALLTAWLNHEESGTPSDLGRLVSRPTWGWPARPGPR